VLTSVSPNAAGDGGVGIHATLTFRGNSSLARRVRRRGASEATCTELGWANAKKDTEEVRIPLLTLFLLLSLLLLITPLLAGSVH
jgi:hypothetical protein